MLWYPWVELGVILTGFGLPILGLIVAFAIDLVRREERVSLVWLGCLAGASSVGIAMALTSLVERPDLHGLHSLAGQLRGSMNYVAGVAVGAALLLALARFLAPGPRGSERPGLTAPPIGSSAALLLTVLLIALQREGTSFTPVLTACVPWWLLVGGRAGIPRTDIARRVSAGMLTLAGWALVSGWIARRATLRIGPSGDDLLALALGLAFSAMLAAAGPRRLHVAVGALAMLAPALAARTAMLPRLPGPVPALVGLDGEPMFAHPGGAGGFVSINLWERCPHGRLGPDCMPVVEPDRPLGELGSVRDFLVDGGQLVFRNAGAGRSQTIEETAEGFRLNGEDFPMDALSPELLASGDATMGIVITGQRWTLQHAVSICVTGWQLGYRGGCAISPQVLKRRSRPR